MRNNVIYYNRGFVFRTLFSSLFLLSFVSFIYAQGGAWTMDVVGTVSKDNKKLEGAVVTLFKGATQVQQVITSGNGKFEFKLEPNGDYLITCTKAGHITKKISFNTRNVPDERSAYGFSPFKLEVSIFEQIEGVDVSAILSQPIGRINYVPEEEDFNYDIDYTNSIREQLARLKAAEEETKKKAAEEAKAKALAEKTAKEEAASKAKAEAKARADAEAEAKRKAEEEARNKALAEKKAKEDAEAKARAEAEAKAKADAEAKQKAEEEARNKVLAEKKAKEEAEAKAKADAEAKAKAEADTKRRLEEEAKAKALAEKKAKEEADAQARALALQKEKEAIAAKEFAELEARRKAEEEANAKALAEKKAKEEADARAKAEADAKSKAEADARRRAEEEAKAKALAEQKAKEEAEAKMRAEADAKRKAEEEARLKALAEQKAKEEAAARAKAEAEAKALAEQKSREEALAKSKADAEARAKTEAARLNEQKYMDIITRYNDAIKIGDRLFGAKDYINAKNSYQNALALKPAEAYPKEKIEQINAILAPQKKADESPNALALKYPQGVTEERSRESNHTIIRRIVVKGNAASVYVKKTYDWGLVYFFKNDQPITEAMFEQETR